MKYSNRFYCTVTPRSACADGPTNDAFVMKLDPTGSNLIYSTYLGGSGDDAGAAIAVDSAGEAFIVGSALSTTFYGAAGICPLDPPSNFGYPTTASAYLPTPVTGALATANQYGILTKLTATGGLAYSTYLGPAAGLTSGGKTSWAAAKAKPTDLYYWCRDDVSVGG